MSTQLRRRTGRNRARQNNVVHRLPKTLTANAPFAVATNKQLLSMPSHNAGLTIRRSIRMFFGLSGASKTSITYKALFDEFYKETGIPTIPLGGDNPRLTVNFEWVNFYCVANSGNWCSFRFHGYPSVLGTTPTNAAIFEADDMSSGAGVSSIKMRIPKAAAYSMSNNESGAILALELATFNVAALANVIVDFGGTWTIKHNSNINRAMRAMTIAGDPQQQLPPINVRHLTHR